MWQKQIYNKYGFTLAEVLVTLAIIGVVASLTIPSVMADIKKETIEKKLVSTYSILSNALRMSEVYNGTRDNWDLTEYQILDVDKDATGVHKENRTKIFDTYLMPYLKTINKSSGEAKTLKDLGYKKPWITPNGSVYVSNEKEVTPIILNNGTVLIANSGASTVNNKKRYRWLDLFVDLDGPRGNNVVGKDIFVFVIPLKSGFELGAFGEYTSYNNITEVFIKQQYTDKELLDKCKIGDANAVFCTFFIKKNSWRFPKDYPWM